MEYKYNQYNGYIQENPEYYINKISKMEISGKKTSWNWAAFFFTDAWMLYRKMYKWFIITLLAQFMVGFFIPALFFILRILVGLFGNYLYKEHIDALSTQGALLPADQHEAHRKKYGGTSTKAIGIYCIICFVISIYFTILQI